MKDIYSNACEDRLIFRRLKDEKNDFKTIVIQILIFLVTWTVFSIMVTGSGLVHLPK